MLPVADAVYRSEEAHPKPCFCSTNRAWAALFPSSWNSNQLDLD
jgi:hypothetical protein